MPDKEIFCDLVLDTPWVRQAVCAYIAAWPQEQTAPFLLVFRDFTNLETAQTTWKDAPPDLLVIDGRMDNKSLGTALGAAKPILFLWGAADPRQKNALFSDMAVRDVFEKPVRLDALLARIKACAFALWDDQNAADVRLGPWLFSPKHRSIADPRAENAQKLTEKETALLAALVDSQEPLSREQLLAMIWGYDDNLDTHTLETHIYNLRQKLTLLPFSPQDPFQTVESGYALDPAWRMS